MANKDDINISNSYDDFGDFDFNIDESGTKRDQVAQPSKIRSDYLPSMKSGFVEGLKRELASKMPYTAAAIDQVSSIYNEAKQVTQQFTAEATPLVRSIGRSTNRLMPLVRPFMPKSAYDKITGKLSQIPDEQGELSEEEKQAQQISADINAAFQGSDANAQVRANMENVIGGMRHKATMNALSGLLGQMQTTNKFLTTSLMAYMKKDLELQYRQLYTQRDIASTLRGTAKVLEAELKNITHNSGLPDMIKAKDFQRRTTKREKLRDHVDNFWKNMMSNFKNNVLGQIRTALEGVEMAASGGADMKEMMEEMEGKPLSLQNLIMKGLFRLGGSALGSKVVGKVAKMGQVAMGGFDSIFENFNNNLIRGVENYSRKDNLLGSLLSMFVPQRPQNDTSIQNALSKNPTQPVQFDISTREAIVTIIPGYLAKLNKLVEDIKDPKTEHEELVYSTDERRFVSKTAINETAEGIIDKFLNPEVYGSTDHLAVIATGKALHGSSGKKMRDWFENTAKDSGGRTNRQLVERFFQNIVRSEDHLLDVEALDAYLNNKDVDASIAEYVQMATDGLGKSSRRIVSYILNSLKDTNGNWNATAIRKYQKALDNASPYYEVNAISEKFSVAMNDMSEEKRERIFAILEDQGLYDRREGKLNLSKMNEVTANKRSQIDIGDAVNSWTARRAVEDITRAQAFTVSGVLEHGLDSVNGFMTNVANDAKKIKDKTTGQLKDMVSKGQARMGALTGNFVRSVFGNEMTEAFKLMSGSLIDRYKKANGAATIALDLALVSGEFSDSDLQIVRDFAEQSMKEKDSEKITQMRIGAIGAIENEDLRNIFAEATSGILTKKDAVNHFGTMKQRINMLQEEEVFKQAQDTLKAKLTNVKDKGKSVKDKAQKGFAAIKNWFTDVVSEGKKGAQEAASEPTESTIDAKGKPKSKAAALAEAVQEKAKAAGKSISEAMDDTLKAKADINEVLVKGLDEYKVYITTMDENVARIYTLLEKKLGNLSEEELTELHEKAQKVKDELQAKQEQAAEKKKGSFGKKLKGFLGGAIGALNPFKALNAAKIAAKYQLDSTPESAFHADFQTYFAYRKEMDVCMASLMSRKSIIANTARGLLSGAGKVIGGTARGLGYAAQGLYTAGGKVFGGALPALGYLGGGLIHGGAIALNGIKDLGLAVGSRSWELMKKSVGLGTRALFKSTSKPTEQWYDLYRKDEVGEEGWMGRPILSARKQKKGIFNTGPDGKATGLIKKTDDIAGPVIDKKGNLLITEEDWKAGLVNIEGKSIAQVAKEHSSNALIQIGGGRSLLGGLAAGLGSFLGGGLKGAGSVLAKMMGINWDITKMFGSGLKKAGGFLKGLGSNIAASLGIGTSEKAQRKKYSVIIGEFEKVNKTLAAIKEEGLPTKKKKIKGDKDGDGDRDGSYEDQIKQNEERKKYSFYDRMLALIGREKKDGKVVKKETPWWQKLLTFFTDPKGALLKMLGGFGTALSTIASWGLGAGGVLLGAGKFLLWTLPKFVLWTFPHWFGTVALPAIIGAIAKTGDWLNNLPGKWGTVLKGLGIITAGVGAYKAIDALTNLKNPEFDPHQVLQEVQAGKDQAERGRHYHQIGRTVEIIERNREIQRIQRSIRANKGAVTKAQKAMDIAKKSGDAARQARAAQQQANSTANLAKNVKKLNDAEKARDAANAQSFRLKLTPEQSAKVGSWIKKMKLDKLMDIVTKKAKALKDVCVNFIKNIKTVKKIEQLGKWLKHFFTAASKSKPQVWAKYLRFFSVLKGVGKVVFAALNYLMEPAMMALDGWIRSEVIKVAAEINDPSLIDEYNAQNSFGWGRGLSAVFTLGLSEVYNLSAEAVSEAAALELELSNAENSFKDANMASVKLTRRLNDKIKRADLKAAKDKLTQHIQLHTPDVSDQEEHSSAWYNPGGHLGEAYTNSRLRDSRRESRRQESKEFVTTVVEQISSSIWLPEQQRKDLMRLLEICVKEQGWMDRHPWGVAIFNAIRKLSNYRGENDLSVGKELLATYRYASDLCAGKKSVGSTEDEALKYVWGNCKLYLWQMEEHINSITQMFQEKARLEAEAQQKKKELEAAQQARARELQLQEQRRKARMNIALVAESQTLENNRAISNIDDIFKNSTDTGVVVSKAFENANTIIADYLSNNKGKPFPKDGLYEYGNAIFALASFKSDDFFNDRISSTLIGMERFRALLRDKYKADVSYVHSIKTINHGHGRTSRDLTVNWSCVRNGKEQPIEHKHIWNDTASRETGMLLFVIVFRKLEIVATPVTTRADAAAIRDAAPQGNRKETGTAGTPPAKKTITPTPVPESLKPKDNKPNRKAVISSGVLLPCEGETKEEYEARFRIAAKAYEENTGEPLLNYYAKGSKEEVLRYRKWQVDRGIEPDGVEVKDKDGKVEIYAETKEGAATRIAEERAAAEAEAKKKKETPASVQQQTPPVTPASAEKKSAPEVKPESMTSGKKQQDTADSKPGESWQEKFNRQQGELDALKAMLIVENPVVAELKRIAALQSRGNDLAAENGKVQAEQRDVFGRALVGLKDQKPPVVVVNNVGGQQEVKQVKLPNSPLNLQQGAPS